MTTTDQILGRINEDGNVVLLTREDEHTLGGHAVTRLDASVYPVGSDLSARYEHVDGIVLTREDAERLGIEIDLDVADLRIEIGQDGAWAGEGRLRDGVIDDCAAVLGPNSDQDEAERAYEAIEEAVRAGEEEVEVDGCTYTWTITLRDEDVTDKHRRLRRAIAGDDSTGPVAIDSPVSGWSVEDPKGGRWWPDTAAEAEIQAAADPAATAVRIATEEPMRGEWHS